MIAVCCFISGLITQWLFISRYLHTAFRLPLVFQLTDLYCEMVLIIYQQREQNCIVFSAEELQDQTERKDDIKAKQVKLQKRIKIANLTLLGTIVAIIGLYLTRKRTPITGKIADGLMFSSILSLHFVIIAAIWRLRSQISKARGLNINQTQVILHLGIFFSLLFIYLVKVGLQTLRILAESTFVTKSNE